MVNLLKKRLFWTVLLFIIVFILSILSKWFNFFDFGIFNYSILFILVILIPNFDTLYKEIKNSEIELIKLPFFEVKLLKKYDYYFIGNRKGDELDDLVVLAFYRDVLNEEEAQSKFKEDFSVQEDLENVEIIKQVHYKSNDE